MIRRQRLGGKSFRSRTAATAIVRCPEDMPHNPVSCWYLRARETSRGSEDPTSKHGSGLWAMRCKLYALIVLQMNGVVLAIAFSLALG